MTSVPVREFRLEALVDFVDDALGLVFTDKHIDSMMATLARADALIVRPPFAEAAPAGTPVSMIA